MVRGVKKKLGGREIISATPPETVVFLDPGRWFICAPSPNFSNPRALQGNGFSLKVLVQCRTMRQQQQF